MSTSDCESGAEAGRPTRRQRRVSVVMDDFIKSSSGIMKRQFSQTNDDEEEEENEGEEDKGVEIAEDPEGEIREEEAAVESPSKAKRLVRQSEVTEEKQSS